MFMHNYNDALVQKIVDRFPELRERDFTASLVDENCLGTLMIKQLLNLVMAKYGDMSVSRRSIIYLSLRLWQTVYLQATSISPQFVQPRPIIDNNQCRLSWVYSSCLLCSGDSKCSSTPIKWPPFWEMNSGGLKGCGRLIEVKTIGKPLSRL